MNSSAASARSAMSLPTCSSTLEVASNTSETELRTLGSEVALGSAPLLLLLLSGFRSVKRIVLPSVREAIEMEGFM